MPGGQKGDTVRRSLAVLAVTLGALGSGVGSAAAAPPNFTAAQHLCEAQGGVFTSFPPTFYQCADSQANPGAVSLCERAYGGEFNPAILTYQCATP